MTSSSQLNSSDDDSRKILNFSIEHILNKAGNQETSSANTQEESKVAEGNLSYVPFPWLHCTRYCPPKIPRNQRRETPQKRQLGRHPRIPFTTYQLTILEEKFKQSQYLSSQEVKEISRKLDLADIRVKIWFQNRRARERREKSFVKGETGNGKESIGNLLMTASTSSNVMSDEVSGSWTTNIDSAGVCEVPSNVIRGNVNDFLSIINS